MALELEPYQAPFNMATKWTEVTSAGTKWTQLEPIGFGLSPFGDPTTGIDSGLKIHIRGFGDPTTKWTEHSGD